MKIQESFLTYLVFSLKDANDVEIKDAKVTAYITRLTQAGYDFDIELPHLESGTYKNNVEFPLKGQWEVRLVVKWNQQQYQQSKRIIVK